MKRFWGRIMRADSHHATWRPRWLRLWWWVAFFPWTEEHRWDRGTDADREAIQRKYR